MPVTPVAFAVVTGTGNSHVTGTLSGLQASDVVTVMAISEGASGGDTFNAPTTSIPSIGTISQRQLHAAASNPGGGLWTFTLGAGTDPRSGTVTLTQGGAVSGNFDLYVSVSRGAIEPTAGRTATASSASRTLAYTASQAGSQILWAVGDWSAAATATETPASTSHSSASPGPQAVPSSAAVGANYAYYNEEMDSQASTSSVPYGIGGASSGPFTILVAEVQASAAALLAAPANFTVTVISDTQIDLAWDVVSGADAYHVYRDSVLVQRIIAPTHAWSDTTRSAGTQYCYYVTAVV